ncbi:MAG: ABC transporter ATP-binding protein [Pelatocladus maniniholoensis HA4357-MV3]|uniref:ABC transporter ATP-binding protein n=1 Tax=Pelatocladus maniniholoensis HA4357-MV3 TaxID=1117104 RepID=A0A9E3H7L4_9NOST|nr:ABC transporter ATP-binding protein [Pelatocladus maniniholoensis HA4357-MV3]
MSDSVIRVENLSKKYVLSHQQEGQSNYKSLREVVSNGAKSLGKKLLKPSGKEIYNSSIEEFWALKDVSFEIKQGDRVGIIGRNGAGKSTLLKILSRITEPTKGRIKINGRIASLLEVGTGFHPELTGRENIFLNGAILGMSKVEIQRKFDEIVDFAEIEKFLDTPVKRYSSGMYVRLAFAVAAHLEPEILIVDEVLAVGDATFQKKCLGKMGEVAEGGRTVIFVSHNMQAIRRLCSKAVYLERGVTKNVSSVEDAIQRYSAQSSMSTFDVDLDSMHRPDGIGEKARLLRLRLAPDTNFSYGEPLKLTITVQCYQKIPDLVIGIGFDTLDGNRIMTLDSDHNQVPLQIPTGIHEIHLCLDKNPLHPTIYLVSPAIHSNNFNLDYLTTPLTWEVSSGPSDLVGDRGFGGCRLPLKAFVANPINI